MKNNIHYSLAAQRDLDEIWEHIASELQNTSAAKRQEATSLSTEFTAARYMWIVSFMDAGITCVFYLMMLMRKIDTPHT